MSSLARQYHTAMNELRSGRITPDDFRSTVRAMKAQHGDAAVMKAKLSAIASSNR